MCVCSIISFSNVSGDVRVFLLFFLCLDQNGEESTPY